MAQVAALLRPKIVRDAEVITSKKAKTCFIPLIDWYKIGVEENTTIRVSKSGVTRDTIKVKVSLT